MLSKKMFFALCATASMQVTVLAAPTQDHVIGLMKGIKQTTEKIIQAGKPEQQFIASQIEMAEAEQAPEWIMELTSTRRQLLEVSEQVANQSIELIKHSIKFNHMMNNQEKLASCKPTESEEILKWEAKKQRLAEKLEAVSQEADQKSERQDRLQAETLNLKVAMQELGAKVEANNQLVQFAAQMTLLSLQELQQGFYNLQMMANLDALTGGVSPLGNLEEKVLEVETSFTMTRLKLHYLQWYAQRFAIWANSSHELIPSLEILDQTAASLQDAIDAAKAQQQKCLQASAQFPQAASWIDLSEVCHIVDKTFQDMLELDGKTGFRRFFAQDFSELHQSFVESQTLSASLQALQAQFGE
ncbi:MAG: hypothetical protein OXT67_05445 [Zetaproteobacteria bacterium]|nr:hypothetical protein [Zetaproteobacteria bacterium]